MKRLAQAFFSSIAARAVTFLALASAFASAPAGADTPAGRPVDGIKCEQMEGSVFHIHQHLTLYDRGKPVDVPGDVGRPLFANCFYWLHTHSTDGIIHVESPQFTSFTLGEFFDIWGVPLSRTRAGPLRAAAGGTLHVFLDGLPFAGDPRTIQLSQHADIVIEAGPPFRKPAPFTDWGDN
jgi:hypothetical protein